MTNAAKATVWNATWLPRFCCRLRRRAGGVHSVTGAETLNARFPGQWFQIATCDPARSALRATQRAGCRAALDRHQGKADIIADIDQAMAG